MNFKHQANLSRQERLTRSSFGSPPVDASWWLGGLSLQGTRSGTRTFHCRGLCNATARFHIYADLDLITDKYNGPFVPLWFQCRNSFPSDSTCKIQLFVDVCTDGLTEKGIKWRRKKNRRKAVLHHTVLTHNSYIRCHPCHHIHSGIMFLGRGLHLLTDLVPLHGELLQWRIESGTDAVVPVLRQRSSAFPALKLHENPLITQLKT